MHALSGIISLATGRADISASSAPRLGARWREHGDDERECEECFHHRAISPVARRCRITAARRLLSPVPDGTKSVYPSATAIHASVHDRQPPLTPYSHP